MTPIRHSTASSLGVGFTWMRKPIYLAALALSFVAMADCGGAADGGPGGGGSPGGGTGGNPGTGGGGGSANTGGGGGSGPSTGTGGSLGTGGGNGTGGSAGTGGSQGTGGSTGTGGAVRDGGAGGATGTGGTAGTGGVREGGAGGGAPEAAAPTGPVPGLPEYWIGPLGRSNNPGTQALPFGQLADALTWVRPGGTIWVLPGTYQPVQTIRIQASGTQAAPINIKAVAGNRPLFSFMQANTTLRGIDISGDWWHITGLELQNSADNCINISGSHNTIENVIVHGCGDTGIQITVEGDMAGVDGRGASNTVLNCDSWGNLDVATGGENADGFAAKLALGAGNVFDGCRAWNNADDGWDLFAANDMVIIRNCWSFSNGKTLNGGNNPQGDGNGFKLGGAQSGTDLGGAVHMVINSFAFDNLACGFTQNNNPRTPSLNMCGSLRNPNGNYCGTLTQTAANNAFTMTAAQALTVQRNADGSLPAIR